MIFNSFSFQRGVTQKYCVKKGVGKFCVMLSYYVKQDCVYNAAVLLYTGSGRKKTWRFLS
jgi:hypothetical protein